MNMTRWNALRELEGMSERLNRLFANQDMLGVAGKEDMLAADWFPCIDVSETDEAFELKAELPEVTKDGVRITMERGVLTLQGERKKPGAQDGRRIHRMERSYGRFVRSFTLPDMIDVPRATATFKDGVLHLRLPKMEKAKPKAIEVKAA